MAFINLKFFSNTLGMQTEIYAVVPQKERSGEIGTDKEIRDTENGLKCLYLLHGLSDDHSIWLRRTSIERYADKYGICVVMPCAAKSFYCNMKGDLNYYDYIAKELPQVIREFLRVSPKREDNYIAGLSMGGYGALKIALKEGSFCKAAGLSPVADIKNEMFSGIMSSIFGDEIPDDEDLHCVFKAHNKDKVKPKLYICIGKDDFMYEDNQKLLEEIKDLDYDFTYKEAEGEHCWEFWDEHIQNVLKWMF